MGACARFVFVTAQGDCTSRSCGAFREETPDTLRERRGEEEMERTRTREELLWSLPRTYPRSLVLICLLGFRATGQNSCLSFGLFARAFSGTGRRLVLSTPFIFFIRFFLYAISLPIHRSMLGPCKGSRLRQPERREGAAAEAFSNRIPHCRLGNSRRIEITHYTVMSGAFTSTR